MIFPAIEFDCAQALERHTFTDTERFLMGCLKHASTTPGGGGFSKTDVENIQGELSKSFPTEAGNESRIAGHP